MSGLEVNRDGGYLLSGTRMKDAAPEALGSFDAVVLSDAMVGNPGDQPAFTQRVKQNGYSMVR